MKPCYFHLSGGLGNQLFQFSAAYAFSKQLGLNLKVDSISGFSRDSIYRRKFELEYVLKKTNIYRMSSLESKLLNARYKAAYILSNYSHKIGLSKSPWHGNQNTVSMHDYLGLRIIKENAYQYTHIANYYNCSKDNFLLGYWQSPQYFNQYESELSKILMPPLPESLDLVTIQQKIDFDSSIMVGIRLYEESPNPESHYLKPVDSRFSRINKTIAALADQLSAQEVHIFSSASRQSLNFISSPVKVRFFLANELNISPLETLWLLTRYKYYIITNSTFYWWGAYLSQYAHHSDANTSVCYSDSSFINQDIYPTNWLVF
jgi:hypothetical protein